MSKISLLCQIIALSFGIRITGVILYSKVRCHDNEVYKGVSNIFRNNVLCLQLWLYRTFFFVLMEVVLVSNDWIC